jgi:hypothetical protein
MRKWKPTTGEKRGDYDLKIEKGKSKMSATTVILPRPVKPGEFYCHRCEKFIPMSEHWQHAREHEKLAKKA